VGGLRKESGSWFEIWDKADCAKIRGLTLKLNTSRGEGSHFYKGGGERSRGEERGHKNHAKQKVYERLTEMTSAAIREKKAKRLRRERLLWRRRDTTREPRRSKVPRPRQTRALTQVRIKRNISSDGGLAKKEAARGQGLFQGKKEKNKKTEERRESKGKKEVHKEKGASKLHSVGKKTFARWGFEDAGEWSLPSNWPGRST